jgi:nascent polypeptide-associated complex subunit alpha
MPKIEEVHDISSSSEDEMPELENANEQSNLKLNRAEKKIRKAMAKIGMIPVAGIERVSFKRGKQIFVVNDPEIVKNNDSFVVFGEAKVEDLSQQMAPRMTHTPEVSKSTSSRAPKIEEIEETGDLDESGLEQKDIELVMSQVSCTRRKAVNALRAANGDIVEAIMQLSS